MTEPPWGAKPPAVSDVTWYWTDAPPHMSQRCVYWLNRFYGDTWRPNRRLRREGYHAAAEHLGIWIWEYFHIITPLFEAEEVPSAHLTRATSCT